MTTKNKVVLSYGLLCFMLFNLSDAWAQSPDSRGAAEGQKVIRPLKVGDMMYDVELKNIINYGANEQPTKLSDFKGKLLILDFWATWCAPCVAMLPKMDSLQREYRGKMNFLSITSEKKSTVRSLLERHAKVRGALSHLTFVVEDQLLKRMFPHATLPHYVWMDEQGKIVAITGHEEISGENIAQVVLGKLPVMKGKTEIIASYNPKDPLFYDEGTIRGTPLVVSRTLAGHVEGIGSGYVQTISIDDCNDPYVRGKPYRRITARNLSIAQLYQLAFTEGRRSFGWHNTRLEVQEPDELQLFASGDELVQWWRSGNGYCYEIIMPKARSHEAWEVMVNDLERHFPQYTAHIENKAIPALGLVRMTKEDRIASKSHTMELDIGSFGGRIRGYTIPYLLRELNDKGLKRLRKPLIDLTEYTKPVDLEIQADLSDLNSVNRSLEEYGLRLIETDSEEEVLIIRDAISDQLKGGGKQ